MNNAEVLGMCAERVRLTRSVLVLVRIKYLSLISHSLLKRINNVGLLIRPRFELCLLLAFSLKDATGSSLLLECDSTVKDNILRHLTVYKIRRKVKISTCEDLSPWAVLPKLQSSEGPVISSPEKAPVCLTDPRTEAMGWRLILDNQVDPLAVITSCRQGDTEEYHRHRYSIGMNRL